MLDTQKFAMFLEDRGFKPIVAGDVRPLGEKIVSNIIGMCDMSIVVAFDKETERLAKEFGVKFIASLS